MGVGKAPVLRALLNALFRSEHFEHPPGGGALPFLALMQLPIDWKAGTSSHSRQCRTARRWGPVPPLAQGRRSGALERGGGGGQGSVRRGGGPKGLCTNNGPTVLSRL